MFYFCLGSESSDTFSYVAILTKQYDVAISIYVVTIIFDEKLKGITYKVERSSKSRNHKAG